MLVPRLTRARGLSLMKLSLLLGTQGTHQRQQAASHLFSLYIYLFYDSQMARSQEARLDDGRRMLDEVAKPDDLIHAEPVASLERIGELRAAGLNEDGITGKLGGRFHASTISKIVGNDIHRPAAYCVPEARDVIVKENDEPSDIEPTIYAASRAPADEDS